MWNNKTARIMPIDIQPQRCPAIAWNMRVHINDTDKLVLVNEDWDEVTDVYLNVGGESMMKQSVRIKGIGEGYAEMKISSVGPVDPVEASKKN